MTIVAVVSHWDEEGRYPSSYVEQVGERYHAVYGTIVGDVAEEEVIGSFADVQSALHCLRQREYFMWARSPSQYRN